MFGRNKNKDSQTANSFVLECRSRGGTHTSRSGHSSTSKMDHDLTLRVTFPDGMVSDLQTTVHDYGLPFGVGEQLMVHFDPADRSKVWVDVEELKGLHKKQAEVGLDWNRRSAELQRRLDAGEITEAEWEAESEKMLFEDDDRFL